MGIKLIREPQCLSDIIINRLGCLGTLPQRPGVVALYPAGSAGGRFFFSGVAGFVPSGFVPAGGWSLGGFRFAGAWYG